MKYAAHCIYFLWCLSYSNTKRAEHICKHESQLLADLESQIGKIWDWHSEVKLNKISFAADETLEGTILNDHLTCLLVCRWLTATKMSFVFLRDSAKCRTAGMWRRWDHDRREDRSHKHRGFEVAGSSPHAVTFCCFLACFCSFFCFLVTNYFTRNHDFGHNYALWINKTNTPAQWMKFTSCTCTWACWFTWNHVSNNMYAQNCLI